MLLRQKFITASLALSMVLVSRSLLIFDKSDDKPVDAMDEMRGAPQCACVFLEGRYVAQVPSKCGNLKYIYTNAGKLTDN